MKILELKGILTVETGLHIGGGNDAMMIGGIDNAVVKTRDGKPYVPGSSLKGKMRSLLEIKYGLYKFNEKEWTGSPCDSEGQSADDIAKDTNGDKKLTLLKLFGDPNPKSKLGITRATFGDCYLADDTKEDQLTEAKYENTVDRKKGTATNPRQTERVCAGVKFNYSIRVKVLKGDDEEAFEELLKEGLALVEADYLGGSGSRGYGRVSFSEKEKFVELGNETV